MNKNNVKWFKSKRDIKYNLQGYKYETNILFITGLVGSGKTTLASKLGKEYNATVIIQDYLAWSDCYDNDECKLFVNLFQKLYPETKDYFRNNEWRKNNLTSNQKDDYRKKFDKMVVDYIKKNKDRNFIYEGSDLFYKSDINLIMNNPIIVKRISALTSFIRSFRRGNKGNDTFKKKINYIKRMIWEFNRFYIKDLPRLNKFIANLSNNQNSINL